MKRNAEIEVIIEKNILIPMRDGVCLSTDLYFPAKCGSLIDGKHPTLFYRTPYRKADFATRFKHFEYFAKRGYIVLLQDCRGRYESEGDFDFMLSDAEDGYDTLQWIDSQDWSNGKVGSFGVSWSGWSQTAMAALGPENLTCMIPAQSGANAYEASIRQGGALELRWLAWLIWNAANNSRPNTPQREFLEAALNLGAPTVKDLLSNLPIRKGETHLKLAPDYEDWILKLQTKSDHSEFWDHPTLAPILHVDKFPNCATVFVGAWYDSYAGSVFEIFNALSKVSTASTKVIVGPWVHGTSSHQVSHAGAIEFGPDAAIPDFSEWQLNIFDWAMRGDELTVLSDAPISIFVMGGGTGERNSAGRLLHGGKWRDEYEWPLARTKYQSFYLNRDGLLSTSKPDIENSSSTYAFNPSDPVPTIGGSISSLSDNLPMEPGIASSQYTSVSARRIELVHAGGHNQVARPGLWGCKEPYLPLSARQDVLVFQTGPLDEDLEVTGPIEVKLWISSSAPDTDFTAKLIDSYPPSPWCPLGFDLNITDGIQRVRYRHGDGKPRLVTPEEIVEVTIRLYPTSNVFAAGHRIRLDISSSNFPRFDVNPNTGGPIGIERRKKIADNTVYHSKIHASHIVLPIIPSDTRSSV